MSACFTCGGTGIVEGTDDPRGTYDVTCGECRGRGISPHQSQLAPKDNKFHSGNGENGKHYWLTPPSLYEKLRKEFRFTTDPAPHPIPEGYDGLTQPWGKSNYVNPPFGSIIHQGKKKGPTAWMRKAISENQKGKQVVLVYPVDKWILMMLAAGAEVRNLGDVKWLATEDGSEGKGTGRHIAAFILRKPRFPLALPHVTCKPENSTTNRRKPQMPKVKLLDDENVVALLDKRVGQAQALAAKDAVRTYKSMVRTVKEALAAVHPDKKVAKTVTTHVLEAMAAHAPGQEASQAAE